MIPAVCLLLLGVVCGSLAQGQEWSDVGNPCDHYRCSAGSVCVPVVNELLQLPVAHCVEETTAVGAAEDCSSYEVGVSVVSCRTEEGWREAAKSRCGLTDRASVEVRHPCHRRRSESHAVFLQATITCCPDEATAPSPPETTPTPVIDSKTLSSAGYEQLGVQEEGEGEGEGEEGEREGEGEEGEGEGDGGPSVVVISGSLGACALLLMVVIVTLKLLYCLRGRTRAPEKPKLVFVTSYINPSSEGWGEGWGDEGRLLEGEKKPDYSYVIANTTTD